jgi:hypothetical protein
MIKSLPQLDKQAFELLLNRAGISFEDLSRNDNRSQFPSDARNLDYRLRTENNSEILVELEGRDAPKGRIQPSKAWLKENELFAMTTWENAGSNRMSLIVFAFRSEDPFHLHEADLILQGVRYVMLGIKARDYALARKARCTKEGWATCDLKLGEFERLSHPIDDYFGSKSL